MKKLLFLFAMLSSNAMAWDGYDREADSYVEIESGNLVRPGESIELYDHQKGQYHSVDVESINSYGGSTEIEVYDWDTAEYRTLEMD